LPSPKRVVGQKQSRGNFGSIRTKIKHANIVIDFPIFPMTSTQWLKPVRCLPHKVGTALPIWGLMEHGNAFSQRLTISGLFHAIKISMELQTNCQEQWLKLFYFALASGLIRLRFRQSNITWFGAGAFTVCA
jgi:hypothetical protein